MGHGLDWSNLQYFHEVARTGTLSGAARRLGADHATVGRRIAALEHSLGRKLFERHQRGYSLTRQGRRLLVIADAMEREAARVEAGAGRDAVGGTVRLSTLEGFGNFFMAPRIGTLLRANPGLALEWLTIQQLVALSRREADITVTLSPANGTRFVSEKLTDYRLAIYGAPAYLDRHPPIRAQEDLRAHLFTGYIEDLVFTRGLDYLGDLADGAISARLQNSSLGAQLAAIRAGLCLGVLPVFVARASDGPAGDAAPSLRAVLGEEVTLTRSYWMSFSRDDADNPRVQRVCETLRDSVAGASGLFMATP